MKRAAALGVIGAAMWLTHRRKAARYLATTA